LRQIRKVFSYGGAMPHGPLFQAGARATGADDFGWLRAPHLSFEHWGSWGACIGAAPTLSDRMRGIRSGIKLHGRRETMTVERTDNQIHGRIFHSIAEASHCRLRLHCRDGPRLLGLPRLAAANP
jgi:hypothetical protein